MRKEMEKQERELMKIEDQLARDIRRAEKEKLRALQKQKELEEKEA